MPLKPQDLEQELDAALVCMPSEEAIRELFTKGATAEEIEEFIQALRGTREAITAAQKLVEG